MLDHLHIQNYRLFKDLKIDKLGQVNLIAGKNNTGKTALLEALRIWASKADRSVIDNILYHRDSFEKNRSYENHQTLFGDLKKELKINNIALKIENLKRFELITKEFFKNGKVKNEITWIGNSEVYENPREGVVYVSFKGEYEYNGWENFTIQEEDNVTEILRLIEPKVIDYRIVDSNKPVLRLNGYNQRQSIKSLGDGVSRIFTIAFALVNAKNKTLIIDEFEVGLHHSVQEQLWEIIFKYAKEWNIQVFATTHSQDTVKAFSYVSSKDEYKDMGQYMRLQPSRKTGEIEAVIYPQDSLENSLDLNLETR